MPYLIGLGNKYAHTSDYHADTSGSMMDYLWLSSGSGEKSFGCSGAGCTKPITDDNIFRELDKAGLSWKSYMESIPSAGYMGSHSGLYVKRHDPAPWYTDVINSSSDQQKIVPYTQFTSDVSSGQLPNYSIVVPNLDNDAHNKTLGQADSWLSSNLPALLNSKYFQPGGDGVLIITFDECDAASTGYCGGQQELVYTAVIGPQVKSGYVSNISYKHENTLRTILDLLGVTAYPGASANAAPMSDFFRDTPTPQTPTPVPMPTQTATATQISTPTQTPTPTPTPQGTVITNIQTASGNWQMQGQIPPYYSGCTTNCQGVTFAIDYGITNPSLSNNATKFSLGGTVPDGDALFSAQLMGQNAPQLQDVDHKLLPSIHHFIYDSQFYVSDANATPVLEFDITMSMNGMGWVWDTQCSHRDGNWDTWSIVSNRWVPSGVPCKSVQGWNHVVIQMERMPDNSLHFQSIALNGTTYPVDITYPVGMANANGWGVTANYQMDGNSPQVESSTYLDNFSVTYW